LESEIFKWTSERETNGSRLVKHHSNAEK